MSERTIVVGGTAYPISRQPFIGDLRKLKGAFGFGWGTVVNKLSGVEAESFMALLDDQDFLDALLAWIWMSKLRAGERDTTLADVEQIALDDLSFEGGGDEDEGKGIEATPTQAPTASDRGDADPAPAARRSTRASTKTSTKRSTAASR